MIHFMSYGNNVFNFELHIRILSLFQLQGIVINEVNSAFSINFKEHKIVISSPQRHIKIKTIKD
jgi:small-conductance mechanosensitive channel